MRNWLRSMFENFYMRLPCLSAGHVSYFTSWLL
jgi:hypothetical protein